MSNNEKTDAAPKKLQLSLRVDAGKVQQNIARGRSKTVTVEVKKTRTFSRGDHGTMVENKDLNSDSASAPLPEGAENLTASELTARQEALKLAQDQKIDEENKKSNEAEPQAESTEIELPENEEIEEEIVEVAEETDNEDTAESSIEEITVEEEKEDSKEEAEEVSKDQKSEDDSSKFSIEDLIPRSAPLKIISVPDAKEVTKQPRTSQEKAKPAETSSPVNKRKSPTGKEELKLTKTRTVEPKRSKTRLTITNALNQEERMRSMASIKRARQKAKRQSGEASSSPAERTVREITIPENIAVQELANRMAVRSQDVVRELMKLGIMAGPDAPIDADTAEIIVTEFGHKFKRVTDADVEDVIKIEQAAEEDMESRPPVVTVMGHVDHGKTSLLDAIRSTNVTNNESGGITQHIGAYQVKYGGKNLITFIDTPGHEAFTAMRARGAKVTDIVILVVAADDGIMPQTIEAIHHAKAAEVPIIVAINKMDKPDADPNRVKTELLSHELVPEDMGGDIITVEVSALKSLNLDLLLEAILLQSEMLELKASKKQRAGGIVIEAHLDKGKGIVTSLLVQRGTLAVGDIVVAGMGYGRVKALHNDKGSSLQEAIPSQPVEVLGLDELPEAGSVFAVVEQEKQAREIIEYRFKNQRDKRSATAAETSIENLFKTAAGGQKELNLIIKGDVQGSCEAITGSLHKINNEEIIINPLHSGAGGITESDVSLAATTSSLILGFNVRANPAAIELAEKEGVDIRYYSIIYDLIDDMKAVAGGLMSPVIREEFTGTAEIQQIFKMSKYGKVAGCIVRNGSIKRGSGVRLIRDNVVIHEGRLKTLKRFKEDVNEAKEGYECGMAFENYEDMREGDMIEAFQTVQEARILD